MSVRSSDALSVSQVGTVDRTWLYLMDRNDSAGEIDIAWLYFGQKPLYIWIGTQRHGVLNGNWNLLRNVEPNACFELTGIEAPISEQERPAEKVITIRGSSGSLTASVFNGSRIDFTWEDGNPCGGFSLKELIQSTLGVNPVRD